ncbi:MAG: hypothetical protein HQL02_05705 [Nitrospirae bacterium]|nr:hypothetical protein [Nitrospirota bacterium]
MVQLIMKTLMMLFRMMLFGLLLSMAIAVSSADASFTQADRDRITRLEEGLKAINQRSKL